MRQTQLVAAVEEDCVCLRSVNFTLTGTGLRTSATWRRDKDFLTRFSDKHPQMCRSVRPTHASQEGLLLCLPNGLCVYMAVLRMKRVWYSDRKCTDIYEVTQRLKEAGV